MSSSSATYQLSITGCSTQVQLLSQHTINQKAETSSINTINNTKCFLLDVPTDICCEIMTFISARNKCYIASLSKIVHKYIYITPLEYGKHLL